MHTPTIRAGARTIVPQGTGERCEHADATIIDCRSCGTPYALPNERGSARQCDCGHLMVRGSLRKMG